MISPQKFDYRSRDSMNEKERLIVIAYANEIPGSLFYHLGDIDELYDQILLVLSGIGMFFEGKTTGHIALELFSSDDPLSNLVPAPEGISRFTVLRVRGACHLLYAFEFHKVECHLIQAGSQEEVGHVINFMNRWGPSPLDLAEEDDEEQNPKVFNGASVPAEKDLSPETKADESARHIATDETVHEKSPDQKFAIRRWWGARIWETLFGESKRKIDLD